MLRTSLSIGLLGLAFAATAGATDTFQNVYRVEGYLDEAPSHERVLGEIRLDGAGEDRVLKVTRKQISRHTDACLSCDASKPMATTVQPATGPAPGVEQVLEAEPGTRVTMLVSESNPSPNLYAVQVEEIGG